MVTTEQRAKIQKAVVKANYPDVSRIVQEIISHVNSDSTPITSSSHAQKQSSPQKLIGQDAQNKQTQLDDILTRLIQHEPWEYIRGWAEFYNQKFTVTQDTLIPRIETEMLVTEAIKMLRQNPEISQIIDVGTGSGAIIISIANVLKQINSYDFIATDISEKALKIARNNSKRLTPNIPIQFIKANLVDTQKINFDAPTLILANLPYLTQSEYNKTDPSVKNYEPATALIGGERGFEPYLNLIQQVEDFTLSTKHIWELSPMIIPNFLRILDKKKIPHTTMQDQFDVLRFIKVNI